MTTIKCRIGEYSVVAGSWLSLKGPSKEKDAQNIAQTREVEVIAAIHFI